MIMKEKKPVKKEEIRGQKEVKERPEKPQDKAKEEMKTPKEAPKPAKPAEKPGGEQARREEDSQRGQGPLAGIKLFGLWDLSQVRVEDPGLRMYIKLKPRIVPRSGGRYAKERFYKNEASIVERFMNKLAVSGHKGKKHRLTSGHCSGGKHNLYRAVKEAFRIIEKKTNQNPVQTLVKATENSAILEEVAAYRMGGIIARKAVVVSPKRRLDIALRHMTQGIFRASFKSKSSLAEVIARELTAAANNDPKSFSILEKNRIEKEAEGAR